MTPMYGPSRMWWSWGWVGWWLVMWGSDEFCNRTIAFRLLPPWGALVINLERPMRRTMCDLTCADCPLDSGSKS